MATWNGYPVVDTTNTFISTGAIIGIVVGVLSGLALLIGIIIMIIMYNKKKRTILMAPQQQQQAQMQQQIFPTGSYGQGPWQPPPNYPPPPVK